MSKTPKLNYRYFAGWKVVGRYVRRGEKSRKRDKDGRPVFHIDQTEVVVPAVPGRGDPKWYHRHCRCLDPHAQYEDEDASHGITAFDIGADF